MVLKKTFEDLGKKYNKGEYKAILWASDIPVRDKIPSGSLALDFAIGGGMPSDRCVELAGGEGAGKTTLALHTLMNFLDASPSRGALFLDTEHKLTESWMRNIIGGERMERTILAWPDHMEQAHDMYADAVTTGDICITILDSIGGAPTKRVLEDSSGKKKSAETGNFGGNALAVTNWANYATGASQKYHCLTLGLNQIREDMDGWNRHMTPGGRGWKHACILRLQLKKGQEKKMEKVNGEDIPVGVQVKARVIKNQLAVEGRTAQWFFHPIATPTRPFGIDTLEEIIRLSTVTEVVRQGGAYYYYDGFDGGKVKGREGLERTVRENPEITQSLSKQVLEVLTKNGEIASKVAPIEIEPFIDYSDVDPDGVVETNVFGKANGV